MNGALVVNERDHRLNGRSSSARVIMPTLANRPDRAQEDIDDPDRLLSPRRAVRLWARTGDGRSGTDGKQRPAHAGHPPVTRYWIGVASRDHVLAAVQGGFCQLNHGNEGPMKRLAPGDRIIYYSPKTERAAGQPLQAFTALGEVLAGEPYQVRQSERFQPFRRDVRYFDVREAPIRPLLPNLSFAKGGAGWGQVMRRGAFRIEQADYRIIATALSLGDDRH